MNQQEKSPHRTFLDRLNIALAESGISRSALADHLGTAKSTITRWSHGAIPRAEVIRSIAELTGVRTLWLATGMEPMHAPSPTSSEPSQGVILSIPEAPPTKPQDLIERELNRWNREELIKLCRLISLNYADLDQQTRLKFLEPAWALLTMYDNHQPTDP